jgi:hypothetical protein
MDTYRGTFSEGHDDGDDFAAFDYAEDEAVNEPPPSPVGQDERRMQVRAYNHWASLLDNRNFPSIEDLDPESLPDFGPYSVLLDFTGGIENPSIQYLGDKLAEECGAHDSIAALSDVPSRSLLSRITDHYMQILANQAPIGFEAEFLNQREKPILYRGILLPFSSDDDTIDFIYGVINWKELADQQTSDELLQEIDSALEVPSDPRREDAMTDWADGPSAIAQDDSASGHADEKPGHPVEFETGENQDDVLDLAELTDEPAGLAYDEAASDDVLDLADLADEDSGLDRDEAGAGDVLDLAGLGASAFETEAPEADYSPGPAPERTPLDLAALGFGAEMPGTAEELAPLELLPDAAGDMELADWLASARELAEVARGTEDRTRQALYAAIGRAYDFSLAAAEQPQEFAELAAESGLTIQDRAPLTPVVKLVFGIDYDKTRLAEFAAALSLARRRGLERGSLAGYLTQAPGGLKGVVSEERRLKREESGKPAVIRDAPREALARKLRKLDHMALEAVPAEGSEFTLLVARRLPSGEVVVLGEVADDVALLERAARKILS